jgi:peroxiredoxin
MVIFRSLVVLLCLLQVCFAQHTPRKCADVPIPLSDGKTIHLSQYHGKVIMIVLMRTDCPECHQVLGLVSQLQKEMGPRGFQGIAISLEENTAAVKPFAERYRFPFPVGHLDPAGAIKLMELNATARPIVPYLMFVDWEGNVRFQYAGNDPIFNSGDKYLRSVADGLVRQAIEKKGPQYETKPAGKP